jgi:hypothetical protein
MYTGKEREEPMERVPGRPPEGMSGRPPEGMSGRPPEGMSEGRTPQRGNSMQAGMGGAKLVDGLNNNTTKLLILAGAIIRIGDLWTTYNNVYSKTGGAFAAKIGAAFAMTMLCYGAQKALFNFLSVPGVQRKAMEAWNNGIGGKIFCGFILGLVGVLISVSFSSSANWLKLGFIDNVIPKTGVKELDAVARFAEALFKGLASAFGDDLAFFFAYLIS